MRVKSVYLFCWYLKRNTNQNVMCAFLICKKKSSFRLSTVPHLYITILLAFRWEGQSSWAWRGSTRTEVRWRKWKIEEVPVFPVSQQLPYPLVVQPNICFCNIIFLYLLSWCISQSNKLVSSKEKPDTIDKAGF